MYTYIDVFDDWRVIDVEVIFFRVRVMYIAGDEAVDVFSGDVLQQRFFTFNEVSIIGLRLELIFFNSGILTVPDKPGRLFVIELL